MYRRIVFVPEAEDHALVGPRGTADVVFPENGDGIAVPVKGTLAGGKIYNAELAAI